ncbi:GGDEF domain-containing protein [Aquabacterium lacunae]|uniref:diguanylate cyclase n=1 Tax=Aquabacterium lacunae TaxID=2528630 RepID=A0A4V2JFK9_9BURK|nr:GGDEF domain-containing protein [Aquabacterium lacunae]TBO30340.1 GGDEF domain-containing protein [Aquabacterium lacunae]
MSAAPDFRTAEIRPMTFRQAVRPLLHWMLGFDRATRERVLGVGLCVLVYLACSVVAHHVSQLGMIRPWMVDVLLWAVVPLNLLMLAAIRSGCTRRLKDPALTVPLFTVALVAISLAYIAIRPGDRGVVLGLITLVMVFGMYTHSPTHTLVTGIATMAVLGPCMAVLSRLDPVYYPGGHELLRFELLGGTVPVLIYASLQLAEWRNRLRQQRRELEAALAKVQELATRDGLTGLYNRRHMQELLDASVDRLERYGERFSVALIDLDHFKRINDTHGHRVGDEVLISFSRIAAAVLRETDVLARWGGEEFIMLFPNSSSPQAMAPLWRLQSQLRQAVVSSSRPELRVTFSAGVAIHVANASLGQTLERADTALYEAKRLGRDRVLSAVLPPSAFSELETWPDSSAELLHMSADGGLAEPSGIGSSPP